MRTYLFGEELTAALNNTGQLVVPITAPITLTSLTISAALAFLPGYGGQTGASGAATVFAETLFVGSITPPASMNWTPSGAFGPSATTSGAGSAGAETFCTLFSVILKSPLNPVCIDVALHDHYIPAGSTMTITMTQNGEPVAATIDEELQAVLRFRLV